MVRLSTRASGALLLAAAVALAALPARAAEPDAAGGAGRQAFLGLWEGVDPLDGSLVYLSITDLERHGVLELAEGESFFTFCARLGRNYSQGRGVITGRGPVVGSVFRVKTTFTCINDEGVPGKPLVGTFDYALKEGGRVLVVPGATPETPDVPLHRLAR
jgi:hypothetical protein